MITQFIYNIFIYISTKQIPFFTIYRYHFEIYKTLTIGPNNPYIIIKIKYLKSFYKKFKNKLSFVKDQMIKYYNIKRIKRSSFEKRSKTYLFYKNITIKRSNDKLDFKKFGLFIIARKISEHNYKLSLSKTIQIHLIFNISLFELALKSTEE